MRRFIGVVAIVILSGCSVHYGPRVPGFVPGYVDQRLGDNTYQVKIGEAWPKDWPDLGKFAIYRAAEITQSRGKRYFSVLAASTQVSNYVITTPPTTTTSGTAQFYGNTAYLNSTSVTSGGASSTISGGWYTLEFKIIDDSETSSHGQVVDAEMVKSELKYFIDSKR